ncbi:LamG-like jellyroll fold domain-containing protein [Paenarthrobacter sp. AMU7]|uniref:LamG-like jellyroll fold domain-containing protein n=1 Tax=Paenarthrobacter sp. AMU7 TaxID=3162492 RepID=A0AB39YPW3_9MICC
MRFSSALFRRACVPVLSLGLLSIGLAVPAANADTEPSTPAVDAPKSEASAVAEATATAQDVVVDAATSPTSKTTAHPDGTLSTTISNEPVRMKTGEGWTDISTDLVHATVDGVSVLKPENVPVDITVGKGGTSEIASLDDKKGHSITQSWPFGTLPVPVVEGNSATYRQVLPGVDLIQLVHKAGISQVLKIETAEAARDPRVAEMRIFLDSENLVVAQGADGELTGKGTDSGDVELHNTGGLWWDSSAQGATATDPGGQGVSRPFELSLRSEAGKQAQVFGMDEILDTAGLTFPVYVDPDWTFKQPSYVFVDTAYPGTSYWNGNLTDGRMHVGYLPTYWAPDGRTHLARSYFQFDTSYIVGKDILAARLNTVETWSSSCTPANVASWVTGDIGPGTTWNVQPGLIMQTDMGAVAKGYSTACPAGSVGFDLMAAKSILLNKTKWNVMLAAGNESDPLGWKKFQNTADITVTHNVAPNIPVFQSISDGRWFGTPWTDGSRIYTRDKTPSFTVQASDPDSYDGGTLTVQMSVWKNGVWQGADGNFSGVSPGGANVTWQDSPALADGSYTLRAIAKDKWGLTSPLMAVDFTVDTTAPSTPKITPITAPQATVPSYPNGVIGETLFSFKLSSTDAANKADGYIFAIQEGTAAAIYPADLLNCSHTRVREFVVVCPGYGQDTTITITALDEYTSLTVWAFDDAGNIAMPIKGAPAHVKFSVPALQTLPNTQTDFLELELSGAEWIPAKDITTSQCADGKPINAGTTADVLNFPTTGTYADTKAKAGSTVRRAIDPGDGFSVAAWVCPKTTTGLQPLISQLANSSTIAAALRFDGGTYHLGSRLSTGIEERVSTAQLAAGQWTYVTAVYDNINAQLRITTANANQVGDWTIAASPNATHVGTDATQPVRLGQGFAGQIYRPVMTQRVLSEASFGTIQTQYGTTRGLLK